MIANYLRKERRKIPGSVESESFTKTGKIKNTTQTHEIKSEIVDIFLTSLILSLSSIVLISSLFRILTKVAILLAHLVALTVKLSTFS